MDERVIVSEDLLRELREAITSKLPPRNPEPPVGSIGSISEEGRPRFGSIYFGLLRELSKSRHESFSTKHRYWMVKTKQGCCKSACHSFASSVPLAPMTTQPKSGQADKILKLPPGYLSRGKRRVWAIRILLRVNILISMRCFRDRLEFVRRLEGQYLTQAKRKLGYEC